MTIVEAAYVEEFECFTAGVGLDSFKPITVVIGRNNSGKSRFVDLIRSFTGKLVPGRYEGILDGKLLKAVFPANMSGGSLGPNNYWAHHGSPLVGKRFGVSSGSLRVDGVPLGEALTNRLKPALLKELVTPLYGKRFRHLLADRDVMPEPETNSRELAPNGQGATNLVRQYINLAEFDEELIHTKLVEALATIFSGDGEFKDIRIRQDGSGGDWEMVLEEPKKGRVPLSASGSGLKTVLLVLLNLLVVPEDEKSPPSNYVFAFEELENNLHPRLLRRLLEFITKFVEEHGCHVVLTTHSGVALDYFGYVPNAQIVHVTHDGDSAHATTLTKHSQRVGVLNELGAKPSDLLQANGVLWLEGPSDRTYMNRFIELFSDGELREGRDYQCAYYGGSVLSQMEFRAPEDAANLTNLLRLNENVAVVCDGDRTKPRAHIMARVKRIKEEVCKLEGAFFWVTEAKEIENYIPGEVWSGVFDRKNVPNPGRFDRFPSRPSGDDFVSRELDKTTFDKCVFASNACALLTKESISDRFDMEQELTALVEQIRAWNR